MKQIQLTKGAVALVDDEDFDRITKHSWYFWHEYATRTYYRADRRTGRLARVPMHREILGLREGEKVRVIHLDGNKLNNCKSNLSSKRLKTPKESKSFLHF